MSETEQHQIEQLTAEVRKLSADVESVHHSVQVLNRSLVGDPGNIAAPGLADVVRKNDAQIAALKEREQYRERAVRTAIWGAFCAAAAALWSLVTRVI